MKIASMRIVWCGVLAMILMVGCGKKEERTGPGELNLFVWSEYVPQTVIEGFQKETGIRVNLETYASNEEMLSKLLGGVSRYDLIQPSEYMVESLIKARKLRAIDFAKVPNLKNIAPEYLNPAYDPGQKYSVPWMAGSVGIVVNTEVIKDPIRTYEDVFQDKYQGRIVVLNDNRELVSWAMTSMGMNPNRVTPEALAKVRPVLARWIKKVKIFDSESPKMALLGGDVDLGIIWSGEAAKLYRENKKFRYLLPPEGAHQFIDCLCIPAVAPHPAAAEKFIDYILRPEVSQLISNEFPYTNPNLEARKLLSKEDLENPASYPKGAVNLMIFRDIGAVASAIDELLTDLKSAK